MKLWKWADAVLVNTALASSSNPEMMAEAFKNGVVSGRMAYTAGLGQYPIQLKQLHH